MRPFEPSSTLTESDDAEELLLLDLLDADETTKDGGLPTLDVSTTDPIVYVTVNRHDAKGQKL